MKRIGVLAIIAGLLLISSAQAFDGDRKGFVLGGGLGFSPVAHWDADVEIFGLSGSLEEDEVGVALQLVIGGAFNEHAMLVYEGNVTGFTSPLFGDQNVAQGFNGASFYYYFGPKGQTFYLGVGLGVYYFKVEDYDQADPGGAFLLSGGYEFSPHWQVGATLTVGSTSESDAGAEAEFNHSNLSIMVSGIAF